MQSRGLYLTVSSVCLALLSSCGGDNGNRSGGITVVPPAPTPTPTPTPAPTPTPMPTPAPTPTPTPTPTAAYPLAFDFSVDRHFSALFESRNFQYFDPLDPSNGGIWTVLIPDEEHPEIAVHITPDAADFIISSSLLGSVTLHPTVSTNSLTENTSSMNPNGYIDSSDLHVYRPSRYKYLYAGRYFGQMNEGHFDFYLLFGPETLASDRAGAGPNTYTLSIMSDDYALGTNGLNLDPASNMFSGTIELKNKSATSAVPFKFNGTYDQSSSRYQGQISNADGSVTGTFEARYFGPSGKELGMIMALTDNNQHGSQSRVLVNGLAS